MLRSATNALRKKGIITEGYEPLRDVWEKRVNLGPLSLTLAKKNFSDPMVWRPGAIIGGHAVKTPPQFTLSRYGMKPMYFGNSRDLAVRIKEVFSREGFDPEAKHPFMVHNSKTQKWTLLAPERIIALNPVTNRGGAFVPREKKKGGRKAGILFAYPGNAQLPFPG
jgi:hypothetical protein